MQARIQLCTVIKGVVSQRLVPRADGKGMVPAVEILVSTARVRELISDPKRTREIHDAIAQGRETYGMISFDQSLTELVQRKYVTYEDALANSTNPDDFALVFRGVSKGGAVGGEFDPTSGQRQPPPGATRAPSATGVHQPLGTGIHQSNTGVMPQTTGVTPAQPDFQVDRFSK
jgi:twitching motility protein PilT